MALGMAFLAVADTIAKVLLEHYPPPGRFFVVRFIFWCKFYNVIQSEMGWKITKLN